MIEGLTTFTCLNCGRGVGIQALVYRLWVNAKNLWFVKNLYCGKDNKLETLLCGIVLIFVDNTPLKTLFSGEPCKPSCCLFAVQEIVMFWNYVVKKFPCFILFVIFLCSLKCLNVLISRLTNINLWCI